MACLLKVLPLFSLFLLNVPITHASSHAVRAEPSIDSPVPVELLSPIQAQRSYVIAFEADASYVDLPVDLYSIKYKATNSLKGHRLPLQDSLHYRRRSHTRDRSNGQDLQRRERPARSPRFSPRCRG